MSDTKELRGLCPTEIVCALDAIAMAKGLERNAYVNHVLRVHVEKYLDELNVVSCALRGNPLLKDATRKAAE